jgi:A/G-specific adenine glycosylase
MLDLGATVCAKRAPACARCPVATTCAWALAGRPEPDPATGSHAVSRGQSRFEGSFRQGRSRLLDVLRHGDPVPPERWVAACGWSERSDAVTEAERAAATLVVDGLAALDGRGALTLP